MARYFWYLKHALGSAGGGGREAIHGVGQARYGIVADVEHSELDAKPQPIIQDAYAVVLDVQLS